MNKCCRTCANIPCTRKECDIENKNACEYYKSLVQAVSEGIEGKNESKI